MLRTSVASLLVALIALGTLVGPRSASAEDLVKTGRSGQAYRWQPGFC